MKNYWKIQKKIISLEEYLLLRDKGAKRPFCKKGLGLYPDGVSEIVRVELKCERCDKVFTTQFSQLIKRSSLSLCTECINHYKTSKQNQERSIDFYDNENYRKKISEGVKRHYQLEGRKAINKRIEKRWKTFEINGIPNFSAKKITVNGIVCESFGEKIFVDWKLKEGYEIERCNFFVDYEYNGKIRHYIPDFKISKEGKVTIIEVKCEYRRNFQKSFEYLQKRVENGFQKSNNLQTYNESILQLKLNSVERFCKENDWEFELITLDNSYFNLLYNREKRKRRLLNGKDS